MARRVQDKQVTPPLFAVGLGASAGGLEALERFFDKAPTDSGGVFIVVMHLSRDFKSMLDELLARHTKMPVLPATDGLKLSADTVYVIQPATTLEVVGQSFRVTPRPTVDATGPATTIDLLFKSIAKEWGARAGAVVLSGSGSDGAQGLIAVHQAGGYACAQSPETAKFDSMPVTAIATNAVRAVDAPDQLAQIVTEAILLPRMLPQAQVATDHDAALAKILRAVVGVSNLDASKYKHSTFERRVVRRMMDLNITSMDSYATRVEEDEIEAHKLAETLLIGVTEFFRDPEVFEVVGQQIVPEPGRIMLEHMMTGRQGRFLRIS